MRLNSITQSIQASKTHLLCDVN